MEQGTIKQVYKELIDNMGSNAVVENGPMAPITSFRTGGNADLIVTPKNHQQLQLTVQAAVRAEIPFLILGNGSNVLVRDGGYKGMIIKIGEGMSEIKINENRLRAGAGALLSVVAKEALQASLTGLEFASGIPGSIGGALFMNAGAYDGEIKQVVRSAGVLAADGSRVYTLEANELQLAYRHSRFQESGEVILWVEFQLQKGEKEQISARMKELTSKRNEKQPVHLPSAGSFFKRPEGHFAGKLIEDAGLKGLSVGGAQISPLHAGFVVNNGDATATDIINLMVLVQNTVYDKFGVMLVPEVRIMGEQE